MAQRVFQTWSYTCCEGRSDTDQTTPPKKIAQGLRPVYTAATVEAARVALDEFEAGIGTKYPAIVRPWRDTWETFPLPGDPPEIGRVAYTTNMMSPINYQLRKVTKNRGGVAVCGMARGVGGSSRVDSTGPRRSTGR